MKSIEISAKSVEDAVLMAASKLGVQKEKLEIEVLEQPVKGLFGMIGNKDAKIKATVILSEGDKAEEFLSSLLKHMDVEAKIDIKETEDAISINLEGNGLGVLIGHRGETLDALQYLTGIVATRGTLSHKRVIVDTQEYRVKREETLKKLAERLAKNVHKSRRDIVLEPMNPYERRIIHAALQENPFVRSYSRGDEPFRRVVLTLKDKRAASPRPAVDKA